MNKKTIVIVLLLSSLSLASCADEQMNTEKTSASLNIDIAIAQSKVSEKIERIEIIDFHGARRCFSCQTIERLARETLEENFQKEMESGKITFQLINIEKPKNREIVQKFQARGSSLFVNVIENRKDNISEDTNVWRLVNDEQAYKSYFKKMVEELLN